MLTEAKLHRGRRNWRLMAYRVSTHQHNTDVWNYPLRRLSRHTWVPQLPRLLSRDSATTLRPHASAGNVDEEARRAWLCLKARARGVKSASPL